MFLQDKVAMITGSSRGIGKAIALEFARQGARVIVTYHVNESGGTDTLAEIHEQEGRGICLQLDVGDPESIRDTFRKVIDEYGTVDILVNNAAVLDQKSFEAITPDEWDHIFSIDCRGVFLCCQEAVRVMQGKQWGRIVNMTSIGGQWGGNLAVHYSAAKAAVISLTRSLARIYSEHGITSNAISPGLVQTEMSSQELDTAAGKAKMEAIPMGRLALAEEVAQVALFLASDMSSYITGQTINVNGGMYFG